MSPIAFERLLTSTNCTHISVAHHVTALLFYNITRCYGKHVTVFSVPVATGDITKYQSFVYGSFVWGIHVRYNKKHNPKNDYYQAFFVKHKFLARKRNVPGTLFFEALKTYVIIDSY